MSTQRKRHIKRQPIEEAIRASISDFIGNSGIVDVERHSYDWRADDLLVSVSLNQPMAGSALIIFRQNLVKKMNEFIKLGENLDDWLITIECEGIILSTVALHDKV